MRTKIPKKRKIVQFQWSPASSDTAGDSGVFALVDDGTLWFIRDSAHDGASSWQKWPELPHRTVRRAEKDEVK